MATKASNFWLYISMCWMDPAWNLKKKKQRHYSLYTKCFRTLCRYLVQTCVTSARFYIMGAEFIWNCKLVEASEWWASVALVFVLRCCSVWPPTPSILRRTSLSNLQCFTPHFLSNWKRFSWLYKQPDLNSWLCICFYTKVVKNNNLSCLKPDFLKTQWITWIWQEGRL